MSAEPTTLVVVDTNVLLAATDRSRDAYFAAIQLISEDERRLASLRRSCASTSPSRPAL